MFPKAVISKLYMGMRSASLPPSVKFKEGSCCPLSIAGGLWARDA